MCTYLCTVCVFQFAGPGTLVLPDIKVTDRDAGDNARISLSCYTPDREPDDEVGPAHIQDTDGCQISYKKQVHTQISARESTVQASARIHATRFRSHLALVLHPGQGTR